MRFARYRKGAPMLTKLRVALFAVTSLWALLCPALVSAQVVEYTTSMQSAQFER